MQKHINLQSFIHFTTVNRVSSSNRERETKAFKINRKKKMYILHPTIWHNERTINIYISVCPRTRKPESSEERYTNPKLSFAIYSFKHTFHRIVVHIHPEKSHSCQNLYFIFLLLLLFLLRLVYLYVVMA